MSYHYDTINFNEAVDSILLMPIGAAQFLYNGTIEGEVQNINEINIWHLEAESNYKFNKVIRETDEGTMITLGYNYEINLVIPHNEYIKTDNILFHLNELSKTEFNFKLHLGKSHPSTLIGSTMKQLNSTGAMIINLTNEKINLNFDLESVEFRPRLLVQIKGFTKDFYGMLSAVFIN